VAELNSNSAHPPSTLSKNIYDDGAQVFVSISKAIKEIQIFFTLVDYGRSIVNLIEDPPVWDPPDSFIGRMLYMYSCKPSQVKDLIGLGSFILFFLAPHGSGALSIISDGADLVVTAMEEIAVGLGFSKDDLWDFYRLPPFGFIIALPHHGLFPPEPDPARIIATVSPTTAKIGERTPMLITLSEVDGIGVSLNYYKIKYPDGTLYEISGEEAAKKYDEVFGNRWLQPYSKLYHSRIALITGPPGVVRYTFGGMDFNGAFVSAECELTIIE
jgi:hypothetical protein